MTFAQTMKDYRTLEYRCKTLNSFRLASAVLYSHMHKTESVGAFHGQEIQIYLSDLYHEKVFLLEKVDK